jgi:hypothetical protein
MCNTFFSQLSLYFAGNLGYDTGDKKILLATSCLTGPAYAYMEPFLSKLNATPEEKPEILTNYQVFVDTITSAFGDSDPTMSAELALRRLRQTTSATSYATEFRRLSSLVFWNNAALVSQYKVNLRDVIQDELARRPVIQDLEELILESIDIDNRLFQRQRTRRYGQYPNNQGESRSSTPSAMEVDKPTSTTPSRQVNQDERVRRNQEKSCYYCGVNGHFSNQCPAKKSNGNRQMISTVLVGNPTTPSPQDKPTIINNVFSNHNALEGKIGLKAITTTDDHECVHIRFEHRNNSRIDLPVRIGSSKSYGSRNLYALLDTGASTSIISKRLVEDLKLPIVPHLGNSHIMVADGSIGQSSGVPNQTQTG